MGFISLNVEENDNILVIAPHPDDESIGCGGLLLKYPRQCTVLVITDGAKGSYDNNKGQEAKIRKKQFERAMEICNIASYKYLDFPDGEMINNAHCFEKISFMKYTKIFIPGLVDNHPDHVAVSQYAIKEIKEQSKFHHDSPMIFQYEVHSTISNPTHYLDITDVLFQKLKMINCHEDQVNVMPYADMAIKLSEYRALQIGIKNRNIEAYLCTSMCDSNNEGLIEREYKIQKLNQINEWLVKWLGLSIDGKKISKKLKDYHFSRISIYGYSTIGRLLHKELINSGIEVVDVFDRRMIKREQIVTIMPENGSREVDVIIVTVVQEFSMIEISLLKQGYNRVMSIQKLLDEEV